MVEVMINNGKISESKIALLDKYLSDKDTRKEYTIQKYNNQKNPLSSSQKRMWFLNKYLKEKSLYNVPIHLRLSGPLNTDIFERALKEVIFRHNILRTIFTEGKGKAIDQNILEKFNFKLDYKDISEDKNDQKEFYIQEKLREIMAYEFELERGPLFKIMLIKVSASKYELILNFHHIIFDGWSESILLKELFEIYQSLIEGNRSNLIELPIQYADYSIWQEECMEKGDLESQITYWRKKLSGEIPVLDLPIDFPRPNEQTFNGDSINFELSTELTSKLKELSQKSGVTLNMTLLTIFKILLYRYTGQKDLLVGTPVAGRNMEEIENLIGFFVNTLVIRSEVKGNESFIDLLNQVKNTCLEAYSNQDMPFEKIVEDLKPDRNLSVSPIFQVMFSLQNTIEHEINLSNLEVESVDIDTKISKYDLSLFMEEREGLLLGEFQFNTDLFYHNTIQRMMKHFKNLVEQIVEDVNRLISRYDFLSKEEINKYLIELNETDSQIEELSIVELFEQQVEKNPLAVAIDYQNEKITYTELNKRANKIAETLLKYDIQENTIVGTYMERSIDLFVSWIGILKAGGTYMPLDPENPENRNRYIINDADVNLIITNNSKYKELESAEKKINYIDVNKLEETVGNKTNYKETKGHQNKRAYVIYTSGSTGKPKGVQITHKGVIRLVKNTNYIQFESEESVGQVSNASFDAVTFEVWGALLNGSKLIIAEQETLLSPISFKEWIKSKNITTMFMTVSLFNRMIQEDGTIFRNMNNLLVGGEALTPKWIEKALKQGAPKRLINGYGPTETTTFALCHEVNDIEGKSSIPIGKPISNTQAYILDEHMQQVPVGVTGELYIGGDGLAIGYLNQPELTSKKFIPNPFSSNPQDKLYMTGDLVKYLPDGNIEYTGRKDTQIKLRGYRIELDEIEEVMRKHNDIQDGVVLVKEDSRGDKKLVGYYTVEREISKAEIKQFLQERLPKYMVPSFLITLEHFPVTSNGKLDRRNLPEIVTEDLDMKEYVAPRNIVEEMLVEIWSEVLGIERIGVYDNFFELGGHSLLAIQVITRIKEILEIEISIRILFEESTINNLSKKIEELFEMANKIEV